MKPRREYDIAKRGDGMHAIYRWMDCPITPPLMSTVTPQSPTPKLIYKHRRYVLVEVRKTFKSALKWIRQQREKK